MFIIHCPAQFELVSSHSAVEICQQLPLNTVEPINTVTNGPKKFGHINGVAILLG